MKRKENYLFTKPPGNLCAMLVFRGVLYVQIYLNPPRDSEILATQNHKKPPKTKTWGATSFNIQNTQPATQTLQDPTLGLHLKLGHQAEGGWIDEWRVSEDMKIFLGPVKVVLLGWLVSVGLD